MIVSTLPHSEYNICSEMEHDRLPRGNERLVENA